MKKTILFFITGTFMAAMPLFAEQSLTFGGKGTLSKAKLHVYIDKGDPAPRCGPNCVRYSILVDDRGALGRSYIEKIVVFTTHTKSDEEIITPILKPITLSRMMKSPGKTEQVVISLPMSDKTRVEDLEFHFIALRRTLLNPTVPNAGDYVIDEQGIFSGADLKKLEPVDTNSLLLGKQFK